jgi:hypothetical protein
MEDNNLSHSNLLIEWLNSARRAALMVGLATFIVLFLALQWIFNVIPPTSWGYDLFNNNELIYVVSLVAALLLASLLYLMVYRQLSLQNSLQQHSRDLTRANHALDMLRTCNEILVHAQTEQELLDDVCKSIVEVGAFPMAWVGLLENSNVNQIKPQAIYGLANPIEEIPSIVFADGNDRPEQGMREYFGASDQRLIPNIAKDTLFRNWQGKVDVGKFTAAVLLPMMHSGELLGLMAIHSTDVKQFDQATIQL